MRRHIIASFAALALVIVGTWTPSVSAQEVASPKIATINMLHVERDALAFQDLRAKYVAANQAFDESARASDSALRAEGTELQQQRAVLAPDAFNQRVAAFTERQRQLQEDFSRRKNAIEQARLVAAEQVKVEMRQIVVAISEQQGINLVLNSSNLNQGLGSVIMLSSEEIDITKLVVSQLNARIQTVNYQPQ